MLRFVIYLLILAALRAPAGECSIKVDTIDYQPQYRILQENGETAAVRIDEYSSFGSFLGIYTVYDPMQYLQRGQSCQELMLDKISAVKSLRGDKREIDWVLRNNGRNARSSEWLDDFDSTFDAYCVFYPEISVSTRKMILKYIGEPASRNQAFNECYICFFKHNNLRGEGGVGNISFSSMKSYINEREVITTAHGVILKRGARYKWLYLTDHVFKLRWPSMDVSNGGNNPSALNSAHTKKRLNKIDSIRAFGN